VAMIHMAWENGESQIGPFPFLWKSTIPTDEWGPLCRTGVALLCMCGPLHY
jgi:hypothetical protein